MIIPWILALSEIRFREQLADIQAWSKRARVASIVQPIAKALSIKSIDSMSDAEMTRASLLSKLVLHDPKVSHLL